MLKLTLISGCFVLLLSRRKSDTTASAIKSEEAIKDGIAGQRKGEGQEAGLPKQTGQDTGPHALTAESNDATGVASGDVHLSSPSTFPRHSSSIFGPPRGISSPLTAIEHLCKPINDFGKFLLERQWKEFAGRRFPKSEDNLRNLTLVELKRCRKDLQRQLDWYEERFAEMYGRKPLAVEFEPIRILKDTSTEMRTRIDRMTWEKLAEYLPANVARAVLQKVNRSPEKHVRRPPKLPPYRQKIGKLLSERQRLLNEMMLFNDKTVFVSKDERTDECRLDEIGDLLYAHHIGNWGMVEFS